MKFRGSRTGWAKKLTRFYYLKWERSAEINGTICLTPTKLKIRQLKLREMLEVWNLPITATKWTASWPFVRNSSHESSTFSTSELKTYSPLHSEKQENEVDESEVAKKKGKVRKGKSSKKVKVNLKSDKEERWNELFDKQTNASEASQKNLEKYFKFNVS